jgi:hypothetical protein|tara:strand:- start:1075 stop:1488 length:414 start_codon:yes stop_codon:yes gene_type:complete
MLRRLIFFGFGVFISIMFLSMGPENRLKNTFYAYIDYFNINKRVINHLISDSTIISDKVNCKMLEYNLSKDDMLSVLNNGKVNFDKSQTIKSPCQIFYIENQENLENYEVIFEFCDIKDRVTVIDLNLLNEESILCE